MPKKWSSSHDGNQEFIGKFLVGFSGQYWFSPFCVASPTWSVGGGQRREVGRERERAEEEGSSSVVGIMSVTCT